MGGLTTPPVGIGLTDLAKSGGGANTPLPFVPPALSRMEKKLDEVEN